MGKESVEMREGAPGSIETLLRGCSKSVPSQQIEGFQETLKVWRSKLERRIGGDGAPYTKDEFSKVFTTERWEDAANAAVGGQPVWTIKDYVGSTLGMVVAECFRPLGLDSEFDSDWDLAFMKALGEKGSIELVVALLEQQNVVQQLAEQVLGAAKQVFEAAATSGDELNAKFAAEGAFEMSYGSKADFFKGLETRIGSPNPRILDYMTKEHCEKVDADREWTTGNYGITTSPRKEWLLVGGDFIDEFAKGQMQDVDSIDWESWNSSVAELKKMDDKRPASWPAEMVHKHRTRAEFRSQNFLKELSSINNRLRSLSERAIMTEEAIGLRLYTGPMFEKYNAVNRGGPLCGDVHPFMESRFKALCGQEGEGTLDSEDNRYTTTIFVVSSALIKASKLSRAETVYRGVCGGMLPQQFWKEDQSGVRGGVELGFMSTTVNRTVAFQYAQSSGGSGIIFEIQTGMIDKGAELSWISQYPHEMELCFPPLTSMEVVGTRVEGAVLVVSIRLNVNLTSLTIEDVVSKRRKVTVELCDNLKDEAEKEFMKWERGDLHKKNAKEAEEFRLQVRQQVHRKLDDVGKHDVQSYNDDEAFLSYVSTGVAIKQAVTNAEILLSCQKGGVDHLDSSKVLQSLNLLFGGVEEVADIAKPGWLMLQEKAQGEMEADGVAALLVSQKDETRRIACVNMGRLGKAAEPHLPLLAKCLKDPAPQVRKAACDALQPHGEASLPYLADIAECLNDESAMVRAAGCSTLGGLGEFCEAYIQKIADCLADEKAVVRRAACGALAEFEEAAVTAIPTIASLLEDEAKAVKEAVCLSLAEFGPAAIDHIDVVAQKLMDPLPDVRKAACQAIGQIDKVSQKHHGLLAMCLGDEEDKVRAAACEALGQQHKLAAEHVASLVEKLQDEELRVVVAANGALAAHGKASQVNIDLLVTQLGETGFWGIRAYACWGLGNLGKAALDHLPALAEHLKDSKDAVRVIVCDALAKFGEAALPFMSDVAQNLTEPEKDVRDAAKKCLLAMLKVSSPSLVTEISAMVGEISTNWDPFGTARQLLAKFEQEMQDVAENPSPRPSQGSSSRSALGGACRQPLQPVQPLGTHRRASTGSDFEPPPVASGKAAPPPPPPQERRHAGLPGISFRRR